MPEYLYNFVHTANKPGFARVISLYYFENYIFYILHYIVSPAIHLFVKTILVLKYEMKKYCKVIFLSDHTHSHLSHTLTHLSPACYFNKECMYFINIKDPWIPQ